MFCLQERINHITAVLFFLLRHYQTTCLFLAGGKEGGGGGYVRNAGDVFFQHGEFVVAS